jgi:8-amino-7-oxononanoate synthase
MSGSHLARRMEIRLIELETKARMRKLCPIQGVNLCSNDYLGLASDPRLKAAALEALQQSDRVGSTGSRLLSGHAGEWDRLEEEFAAFAGTESSLFFNSGFAANTGLFPALLEREDVVFSDAMNHASIIDGIRLSRAQKVIYPHCDLNALEDALRRHLQRHGERVIVTESIFSMSGDRAPLAEMFQLADQYGAEVIVDEAHATGTCGPGGRGLVAEHGLEGRCLAVVHTCGKALAGVGAFVCGSRALIQLLINCARTFIFSTALPSYVASQIRAAMHLAGSMDAERAHLSLLSGDLRKRLEVLGCDYGASVSQIVPVMVGTNEAALNLSSALQERGFAVKAIRFPSVPVGAERLRISLTASLSMREMEQFADAVALLAASGLAHG